MKLVSEVRMQKREPNMHCASIAEAGLDTFFAFFPWRSAFTLDWKPGIVILPAACVKITANYN